jgi:hypothetical protein
MVLGVLAQAQQFALNPMLSVVAMRAHDCTGAVTGGALFEMQGGANGIAYTVVNDLPTVLNPTTPTTVTEIPTEGGNVPFAGFANVNPGNIQARGLLEQDGMRRPFGEARFVALVPGISIVEMRP